jgi:hypothetical protein
MASQEQLTHNSLREQELALNIKVYAAIKAVKEKGNNATISFSPDEKGGGHFTITEVSSGSRFNSRAVQIGLIAGAVALVGAATAIAGPVGTVGAIAVVGVGAVVVEKSKRTPSPQNSVTIPVPKGLKLENVGKYQSLMVGKGLSKKDQIEQLNTAISSCQEEITNLSKMRIEANVQKSYKSAADISSTKEHIDEWRKKVAAKSREAKEEPEQPKQKPQMIFDGRRTAKDRKSGKGFFARVTSKFNKEKSTIQR